MSQTKKEMLKPRPIVLCGPSGCGKTTLLKRLFAEYPDSFGFSVSRTSIAAVEAVLSQGKNVVLDIEMQGVKQIQRLDLEKSRVFSAKPLFIFVAPPSLDELEKRLRGRGTESEESLAKRIETAKGEVEWGTQPGQLDHVIVNDDVEKAYEELVNLIFDARV